MVSPKLLNYKNYNCTSRVITKSRYDGSAGPLLDMLGCGSVLISQIKQKALVKFKTLNNQMPPTCEICSPFVTFNTSPADWCKILGGIVGFMVKAANLAHSWRYFS